MVSDTAHGSKGITRTPHVSRRPKEKARGISSILMG